MLRGKIPHFRLTCVAQKRRCLSSPMTQMEKSTIGSQNWAFLLSSSEFLLSIFGCQGPFSRRSR